VIIGWFTDTASLSAVSVGTIVTYIITNFLIGVTTGGTVVIGTYFGAKKDKEIHESVNALFFVFLLISGILTLVMLSFTGALMTAMRTPPEAYADGVSYVRICSCGIFFITGFNIVSAILRARGDSRRPFYFAAAACATVLSQALSLLLSIVYLRQAGFFRLYRINLRFEPRIRKRFFEILKIGLPISCQETLIHLSFLFIDAIINTKGMAASAAAGVSNKFEAVAMLPATAFSAAIAAFTAQNMGARAYKRVERGVITGIGCSFGLALVFFSVVQFAPGLVFRLFHADGEVEAAGALFMRSYSIDYLLVPFAFCLNSFLNGCGKSSFCMWNAIFMTLIVRIPVAYILGTFNGGSLFGIGFAFPAASFLTILSSLLYIRAGKWRTKNMRQDTAPTAREWRP
jgi:Na+-driven multidrug efflux pump